ncbi:BZIP domain-containing protein [Mycena kentingensis (nom. inval.)]|nr:BZIP domain-containing protein [Mycena kentingensis (nom. inval.)]
MASPQLYAVPSKTWVIPPKPKPGRKPKKDTAAPAQNDEQGRRVQNRAAQRAFRERKQSQLADLQARVQSYEQGEIERNVALQAVAKRLKEENDSLRRENDALRRENALLKERDSGGQDRKRWRDESPASSVASSSRNKKYKLDHDAQDTQVSRFANPYISSPQSMVSSPDSSTDSRFSATPFDAQSDAFIAFGRDNPFPAFDCGYCTPDTPCVCRDVFAQSQEKMPVAPPTIRSIILGSPPPQDEPSILDNLPPYQPPVPLRLRPRGPATQINAIFQVSPPAQPISAQPTCSGDPSNCSACADDSFGKAFCEKLSALPSCDNCPEGVSDGSIPHSTLAVAVPIPSHPGAASTSFARADGAPDTIPTNDAWRRFKAHPNVDFSDLDMLADVVARRSPPVHRARGIDLTSSRDGEYGRDPRRCRRVLRVPGPLDRSPCAFPGARACSRHAPASSMPAASSGGSYGRGSRGPSSLGQQVSWVVGSRELFVFLWE